MIQALCTDCEKILIILWTIALKLFTHHKSNVLGCLTNNVSNNPKRLTSNTLLLEYIVKLLYWGKYENYIIIMIQIYSFKCIIKIQMQMFYNSLQINNSQLHYALNVSPHSRLKNNQEKLITLIESWLS